MLKRGEVVEVDAGLVAAAVSPVPPKTGKGSGRNVWAKYAATVGVKVTDTMDRAAIIAAVEEKN